MSFYDQLNPRYQDWIDDACLNSEDKSTGMFPNVISWHVLFMVGLKRCSREIRDIIFNNAKPGTECNTYIEYLEELIKSLPQTKEPPEGKDDDFDEISHCWLNVFIELSENKELFSDGCKEVIDKKEFASLFRNAHKDVRHELEQFFNVEEIISLLEPHEIVPLFIDNFLNRKAFTKQALDIIDSAARKAAESACDFILPSHILSAVLNSDNSIIENTIRQYLPPHMPYNRFKEYVDSHSQMLRGSCHALPLVKTSFATFSQKKLEHALFFSSLKERNAAVIHIFAGLLEKDEEKYNGKISAFFINSGIKVEKVYADIKIAMDKGPKGDPALIVPEFLSGKDLTWSANNGELTLKQGFEKIVNDTMRILCKMKRNSVIVLGNEGTGRSSFIEQLALEMVLHEESKLYSKKLVGLDCARIPPEGKKDFLQNALQFVYSKKNVILALDGLESIFIGDETGNVVGSKFLEQFHHALQKNTLQFLITMTPASFHATFEQDHRVIKMFEICNLKEPSREETEDIVKKILPELQEKYGVIITQGAVTKTLHLTEQYMLSEYFPKKVLHVIEEAVDLKTFDRERSEEKITIGPEEIITIVAKLTKIPEETLRGETDDIDLRIPLSECVVGQPEAVGICANELSLIKAGMKDLDKPAGVYLFAGMTGTGKTELAKTIANMYSATKRLVTFTMGNFSEPHSISGIIGSPPGYHGHEQGGRLINEINKDPYCVVLLDEIDKAHPEIWKPFLNLFDEGWIVDAKGVRANANRSIFILTSNVGAEEASDIYRSKTMQEKYQTPSYEKKLDTNSKERPDKTFNPYREEESYEYKEPVQKKAKSHNEEEIGEADYEKIKETIQDALYEERFRDTGLRCFTPEFLARIQQVIVFRPLNREALYNILQIHYRKKQNSFLKLRDKHLLIEKNVLDLLADECLRLYVDSKARAGGRIVQKVFTEYIDTLIQKCPKDIYKRAKKLVVTGDSLVKITLLALSKKMEKKQARAELKKLCDSFKTDIELKMNSIVQDFNEKCRSLNGVFGESSVQLSSEEIKKVENDFKNVITQLQDTINNY